MVRTSWVCRYLVAASWATLGVGCHGGYDVQVRAPTDLHCHGKQVELVERRPATFVAQGCGRTVVYQCDEENDRCDNLTELARARAHRDTGCAPQDLRVAEISPHLFQAQGCGRRTAYFCEMKGGITTCVNEENLHRR